MQLKMQAETQEHLFRELEMTINDAEAAKVAGALDETIMLKRLSLDQNQIQFDTSKCERSMILGVVEGQVRSLQQERDQLLAQNTALAHEIQEQKA